MEVNKSFLKTWTALLKQGQPVHVFTISGDAGSAGSSSPRGKGAWLAWQRKFTV